MSICLSFLFINVVILNLSGYGQLPVSMATERVSAESHDQNFIEKVRLFSHKWERERERGWSNAKECVCELLMQYDLPFLSALRKICNEKRKNNGR